MGARVLWSLVAGFLLGVFLRSFFPIGILAALFLALLGCGIGAYGIVEKKKNTFLVCALLLAGALGIARMDGAILHGDPTLNSFVGKTITLEGVVFAEPDARDTSTRIPTEVSFLISKTATSSVRARVLVIAPAHTAIAYGAHVQVAGKLELPEAFDSGLGRQFDYPSYLGKDGIGYQLSFAQVERMGGNVGNPVTAFAIRLKQLFLTGLRRALPEPESGLAGGITVGDKRGPGTELNDTFRTVGLVHIVVLSGYNITVVLNAAATIVKRLPYVFQFGTSGLVVLFFILMSGGAATAVRAGIMALLAVFARETGRQFIALRALGVVAVGMVLWNPWTLAFDPSFQLSALATVGMIIFTPLLAARMQWVPERFGLREIVASTLGTQLTVLPLLLYQNGQLSLVALPANILALPVMPAAMFFSGIAAFAGLMAGPLAPIIALPAYLLLGWVIGIAQLFAAFPFASLSLPAFGAWWLILLYGALCALGYRVQYLEKL